MIQRHRSAPVTVAVAVVAAVAAAAAAAVVIPARDAARTKKKKVFQRECVYVGRARPSPLFRQSNQTNQEMPLQ
jgi:uracil DNA glycosylase